MEPIRRYVVEAADGPEPALVTHDRREAEDYAREHRLRVYAETYRFESEEPIADFTGSKPTLSPVVNAETGRP